MYSMIHVNRRLDSRAWYYSSLTPFCITVKVLKMDGQAESNESSCRHSMQALANSRMMDDGPYCMSTKGQSGSSTLSGDPGLNLLVHFENAIPLCDALLLTRRNSEWNRPISSPSPPGDSWQKPLSGVIFRHQDLQVSHKFPQTTTNKAVCELRARTCSASLR